MLNTDLKFRKSKANGRMSKDLIVLGGVQNVWKHVTSSQRTAGYFDYAEIWCHVATSTVETLIDPAFLLDAPTLSDTDYIMYFAMGNRETIAGIAGTTTGTDAKRKYGSHKLAVDIVGGSAVYTLRVLAKNAALVTGNDQIIKTGDPIRISNKLTADALTGTEVDLTVASVTPDGLYINITTVEPILASFIADGVTRVSSLMRPADIVAAHTTPVKTSAAGTYDFTTYPLVLDNIGTVDQDWIYTFSDGTHFALTGDELGAVGTGTIGVDFSPNNPDYSRPYSTLEAAGFGGTWAGGDIITLSTTPAAFKIGGKRVIPPLTASLSNNKATLVFEGEAA